MKNKFQLQINEGIIGLSIDEKGYLFIYETKFTKLWIILLLFYYFLFESRV